MACPVPLPLPLPAAAKIFRPTYFYNRLIRSIRIPTRSDPRDLLCFPEKVAVIRDG